MRQPLTLTKKPLRRGMRRLTAFLALCAFSFFSFSLGLEHTCLTQRGPDSPALASRITNVSGGVEAPVCSRLLVSSQRRATTNPGDGVCLACAWSQSLIKQISIVQLISPALVNSLLLTPTQRIIPFHDLCCATLKRGPPSLSSV